jgi:hypothetical protein
VPALVRDTELECEDTRGDCAPTGLDCADTHWGSTRACHESELFGGAPMLASLDEVPEPIDLVDVFRRPEHTPEVARDAVAAGARALWLQLGIRSDEARAIAEEAGLTYIQDRCLKVDHARLLGASAGKAG